jgi:hypothetical protein
MKLLFTSLSVLFSLLIVSCNTTEPLIPPSEELPKAVKLQLLDLSCTEAFIKVSAADTVLPVNITLKKDDATLLSFTLTITDTVIIDTTLQPNITYVYQTTEQIKGKEENSDTIQVKTLNTTSHNFNWQTFTFGGIGGGGSLRDVVIINENNIWAVGEIYADTTGQAYNAVHWDGTNWELKRVLYYGNCSAVEYPPLKAIYAFSANNIVITNGGSIGWFDGVNIKLDCGVNPILTGAINKIWGSSSNDLYVVGNSGSMAHYLNGSWSKIESGTNLPINDIWGIDDNGQTTVLAVASDQYQIRETKILSIENNTVSELSNLGLPWASGCIWLNNDFKTYTGGDGLYTKYNTQNFWNRAPLPLYYIFSMGGNSLNDIVVCGGNGYVGHYNGMNWINYLDNGLQEISGNFYSIDIKGNKVCVVGGKTDGKAVVLIGTR